MEKMQPNALIHETSPYLLQHAYNPVAWHAWNDQTLHLARTVDKPILVSIGYATCHWCHVMERESFEDATVAAYMNEHFVCIKIDREERPDIDQIYMDAVQAMGVGGGWPLNVFLLPDTRPFYGGTYFPPRPAHGRMAWRELLQRIVETYHNNKTALLGNATQLTERLQSIDKAFIKKTKSDDNQLVINNDILNTIYKNIDEQLDKIDGGFGGAPKFLGTMSLQYLLEYGSKFDNNTALFDVCFTLKAMLNGGIYDAVGGGIARYATDSGWHVPHFEKMLYDNALFLDTIYSAYSTLEDQREADLKRLNIDKKATLHFLKNHANYLVNYLLTEMYDRKSGGFYTAQDADSEGVEGKFYTWTWLEIQDEYTEIRGKVGNENYFDAFLEFYNITREGNWEDTNILYCTEPLEAYALRKHFDLERLEEVFWVIKRHLYLVREQRIKPLRDEKHLLGWNALLAKALIQVYNVFGGITRLRVAQRNIFEFLIPNFENKGEKGGFFHTFKDGKAQYRAFLDDYAYLLEALLPLHLIQQSSNRNENYGDTEPLIRAIVAHLFTYFWDAEAQLFCFASSEQTDLLVRKKDLYDGAQPSGNSTMCRILMPLSLVFDEPMWRATAESMLAQMMPAVTNYPQSFARWAQAAFAVQFPYREIAVVGAKADDFAAAIRRRNDPQNLVIARKTGAARFSEQHPSIYEQPQNATHTYIYVCTNGVCLAPFHSLEDFFTYDFGKIM